MREFWITMLSDRYVSLCYKSQFRLVSCQVKRTIHLAELALRTVYEVGNSPELAVGLLLLDEALRYMLSKTILLELYTN